MDPYWVVSSCLRSQSGTTDGMGIKIDTACCKMHRGDCLCLCEIENVWGGLQGGGMNAA